MAKPQRPGKGESVLCLPRDYTVVDTETTGLSTESCASSRCPPCGCREGRVAAEFSTLIRPPVAGGAKKRPVATGLRGRFHPGSDGHHRRDAGGRAPSGGSPCPRWRIFWAGTCSWATTWALTPPSSTIPSRNTWAGPLGNNSLDQLRLARKLLPQLPHHRLGDVAAALGVPYQGAHRPWPTAGLPTAATRSCGPWRCPRAPRRSFSSGLRRKSPQSPVIPAFRATPSTRRLWCSPAAWIPPKTGRPCCGPGARWGKRWRPGWISWPSPPRGEAPPRQGGRPVHFAPGCLLPAAGPKPNALTWPPPPTIMDTNTDFWM